jgi:ElaB/YqjD/DUF883 family membrane-anchored ribosome-binding protein
MVSAARSAYPADMLRASDQACPQSVGQWAETLMDQGREYVRQKPEQAVLWALGIGFVLGWKLKPW